MTHLNTETLRPVDIYGPEFDPTFHVGGGYRLLYVATADGVVAGTAEASIIGAGIGSLVIPADALIPGRTIRACLAGKLTSPALVGSFALSAKLGAATLVDAASLDVGLSRITSWSAELVMVCRKSGPNGTIGRTFLFQSTTALGAYLSPQTFFTTAGVDTTQEATLGFTWQWSGSGGTATCQTAIIEQLG